MNTKSMIAFANASETAVLEDLLRQAIETGPSLAGSIAYRTTSSAAWYAADIVLREHGHRRALRGDALQRATANLASQVGLMAYVGHQLRTLQPTTASGERIHLPDLTEVLAGIRDSGAGTVGAASARADEMDAALAAVGISSEMLAAAEAEAIKQQEERGQRLSRAQSDFMATDEFVRGAIGLIEGMGTGAELVLSHQQRWVGQKLPAAIEKAAKSRLMAVARCRLQYTEAKAVGDSIRVSELIKVTTQLAGEYARIKAFQPIVEQEARKSREAIESAPDFDEILRQAGLVDES